MPRGRKKKLFDIDDNDKYIISNQIYKPVADKLVDKYRDFLPFVDTSKILFLSNLYTDDRTKNKPIVYASVSAIPKKIKIAYKQAFGATYEYIMEIRENHIEDFTNDQKILLIYHELMHIAGDGKTYKHNLEDFKEIVRIGGVDWDKPGENVPHILHEVGEEDSPDEPVYNLDIKILTEPQNIDE